MNKCNITTTLMYSLLIIIVVLLLWTFNNNKNENNINNIPNLQENNVEEFINPSYEIQTSLKNYSAYNKVVLKGNCKQDYYSNDILREKDRNFIQNIVKYVLSEISNISRLGGGNLNINNNGIYNFKEINTVLIETNLMGKRYIVDTFIYDIINFHSVRILMDFVCIKEDVYINSISLYNGANNNIMNRFDTISGAGVGILYSKEQFQENWINLMNKNYGDYKLFGVDGSTLESSDLDPMNDNLHKLDINSLGNMILPTYIDNDKSVKPLSSEFCKAQTLDWDMTSANKPLKPPPNCVLHNSATIAQANIPYYTPSIFDETQIYNNKPLDNSWMFHRHRDPRSNKFNM